MYDNNADGAGAMVGGWFGGGVLMKASQPEDALMVEKSEQNP